MADTEVTLLAGTLTDLDPADLLYAVDVSEAAGSILRSKKITAADVLKTAVAKAGSTMTGPLLASTGSSGAPGISFSSAPSTGIRGSLGLMLFDVNAVSQGGFDGIAFYAFNQLRVGPSQNTVLQEDAANTLALRNGANAQVFKTYTTFTDASNHSFVGLYGNLFSDGIPGIFSYGVGTGANPSLYVGTTGGGVLHLVTGSTGRWTLNASGHLLAAADNAYDIGASGANRPRNIFVSAYAIIGTAVSIGVSGSSVGLYRTGNGVLLLGNDDLTSFDRIQIGGTTSAFPSIKRNGAGLDFRLADDSGYAAIASAGLTFNGHVLAGTDNTWDIGATGATRPRSIYVATTIHSAGEIVSADYVNASRYFIGGAARILVNGSGVIQLTNSNEDGFTRLIFGLATSSFPSLKRSSAELQVRLADDSADTTLQALTIKVATLQVVGARKTGWSLATGTPTRTTFDTTTVTLPELAERVMALIADLHNTAGHGLIGT